MISNTTTSDATTLTVTYLAIPDLVPVSAILVVPNPLAVTTPLESTLAIEVDNDE